MPEGEIELLPWKAYTAEYCGTVHGGSTGAAPGSGTANDAVAQYLLKSPAKKKDDDADGRGFGARPILSKSFLSREENRLNADIDFHSICQALDSDDRQISELFFLSRCTALEIAEKFGKDTKRIGDQCSAGERWVPKQNYSNSNGLQDGCTTSPSRLVAGAASSRPNLASVELNWSTSWSLQYGSH